MPTTNAPPATELRTTADLTAAFAPKVDLPLAEVPPLRPIVFQHRGRQHGPITRLMSPSDLGELLKPFVFLDRFQMEPGPGFGGFARHPHSGIATVSYLIEGGMTYSDSTGQSGQLDTGAVEWMRAGGGVWHDGGPVPGRTTSGFQLWLALPPALELAPAESLYLAPTDVPRAGPVSVLIGEYDGASSPVPAPSPMNYLAVRLAAGSRWRYATPSGHTLAWVAVHAGSVASSGRVLTAGDMAVYAEGDGALDLVAQSDALFMLGSAARHPHPLVLGNYSVHTSNDALRAGEAGIRRIGAAAGG